MKILVLIRDLVLSSQIRSAVATNNIEYFGARDDAQFTERLTNENPDLVVIDSDIQGVDPFAAIQSTKESINVRNIICFYSHVHEELEQKARDLGLERIFRRSIFFKDISMILLEKI